MRMVAGSHWMCWLMPCSPGIVPVYIVGHTEALTYSALEASGRKTPSSKSRRNVGRLGSAPRMNEISPASTASMRTRGDFRIGLRGATSWRGRERATDARPAAAPSAPRVVRRCQRCAPLSPRDATPRMTREQVNPLRRASLEFAATSVTRRTTDHRRNGRAAMKIRHLEATTSAEEFAAVLGEDGAAIVDRVVAAGDARPRPARARAVPRGHADRTRRLLGPAHAPNRRR